MLEELEQLERAFPMTWALTDSQSGKRDSIFCAHVQNTVVLDGIDFHSDTFPVGSSTAAVVHFSSAALVLLQVARSQRGRLTCIPQLVFTF